eukprot:COSAG02_NODE_64256_length_261_cov_0.623457_1_plen_54_part_01
MSDCCGADGGDLGDVHVTADYGYSEFFVGLGAATDWIQNCQGDAPCDGPTLVVF